ncbi:PAS domain-containing methyl-accepting chemotaxis protein [Thiomicrorhabdus indica]|uniref:methyl-accepting chemotaxis protein n=1 Tax=Thiomicrorhabdus indica TaxID=2267253 RepID=UPI002AA66DAB|nr:PAS domain-containing methyl-accepting chemotaxis protein [Thiomicrorhabdus indica]
MLISNKKLIECQNTLNHYKALYQAVSRSMALIEFQVDRTILDANENFLKVMGYELPEIVGQKHSLFVTQEDQQSPEYEQFWSKLSAGEVFQDKFCRLTKSGQKIWLEATYNPVFDEMGKVSKVIKFATDITHDMEQQLAQSAQLEAINKVMAVIEFDPQGNILKANDNFLQCVGYSMQELAGQHHRIFVDNDDFDEPSYEQFWQELASGVYKKSIYKRVAKSGEIIWLDASYNPVVDSQGKVVKIVKYANDITERENSKLELDHAVTLFSEVIGAQAAGDLSKSLPPGVFKGPLHNLKNAINYSVEKIKEVVIVAINASDDVNSTSAEVNQSAAVLDENVQQQAAAIEQTSATMEQMNTQVQGNTENAQKANKLSDAVSAKAQQGVEVMRQTNEAMMAIEESSHKISEIVALIDSIAFQTNLLALNAAVEAARAGEYGRGFAVVAGEVRNLAQKSADAAKDIRKLIDETSERVSYGSQMAKRSSETLDEINLSIDDVSQMIAQIAMASTEQAEGVSQVHQVISQIDGATQKSAALVEETRAAAEHLTHVAKNLKAAMSYFEQEPQAEAYSAKAPPQMAG